MVEWLISFAKVLFRPTPRTFVELAENASGKFSTAVFWLFVTAVFSYLLSHFISEDKPSIGGLLVLILAVPFATLTWATSIHFCYQKLFKQSKDLLLELIYALTCIGVVFLILNTALVHIPQVGEVMGYLTGVHAFLLAVLAVSSITKLKIWQSVMAVTLGTILGICVTVFGLMFFFILSDVNARIL